MEKPLFEHALLVDVGEIFPFYVEYVANAEGQQTTEDQGASAQLDLMGHFIPNDGNFFLVQTLWSRVVENMTI